ncbi:hypothetical protein FSST1_001336 [Fusarium sambucinum]
MSLVSLSQYPDLTTPSHHLEMPSDPSHEPSYRVEKPHDPTPSPTIAIKMSQMHKLTSGQSEGHNYEDDELSSDESSISGGNRDRHNVQSQTTNAANISSLRVARSVNKTTQTALPNYRQISVISSPARSYKRHGTSTPLYALKRRRTDPAISNIDSNVASTIGPSLEPSPSLSKRPSTSALLLPKSVFENLDDDQVCL